MSRTAAVFLTLLLATPLCAQTWTAAEQELLDQIEVCWDAWVEAGQERDFDIWVDRCKPDQHYSMWWTNDNAPVGLAGDRRAFTVFQELNETWIDYRPVAISVFGDVGIVQFYGYWSPMVDGKRSITEFMRTEVFRKVDGHWTFLGGQGTPVSSADSAPYE